MRIALFLLVLSVYLLSMTGTLGIDEETMYLVTESIAERGEVAVGAPMLRKAWTARGADGRTYSILEVGQSLLALPFYWMGKAASSVAPPQVRPYATRAAVAGLGPLSGALAVLLVALIVEALGRTRAQGVAVGLLAAFGTILWPYGRTFYREPVLAALLAAVVWAIVRWRADRRARWAAIAACAFFLAGTVRVVTLGMFPFVAGAMLAARGGHEGRPYGGRAIAAGAILAAAIAAISVDLGYNAVRFGSPWATGYPPEEQFSHPMHLGLYGFLFSPGRSVFVFCPVLFLAVAGVPRMWRDARGTLWLVAAIAAFHLCLYACWWAWADGRGLWGPRYLTPMLPLALLPAAWLRPGKVWAAVLGLSIAIQLLGVLTWGRFLVAPEKEAAPVERRAFDPTHSAVLSPDAWASVAALRWDRAYAPSVLRDPHSKEARGLKVTTAAVWWAVAWRAGLSRTTLLPAAALLLVAVASGIVLAVRARRLMDTAMPPEGPA